jgi:hypothetical protein
MKKVATLLGVVTFVLVTLSGSVGAQSGRALTIEDYYKIKDRRRYADLARRQMGCLHAVDAR